MTPSLPAVTKQTKTIQFSLVSPAVLSTGWVASPREKTGRGEEQEKRRKRRGRGREETRPGTLPADVLEMLKKVGMATGLLQW